MLNPAYHVVSLVRSALFVDGYRTSFGSHFFELLVEWCSYEETFDTNHRNTFDDPRNDFNSATMPVDYGANSFSCVISQLKLAWLYKMSQLINLSNKKGAFFKSSVTPALWRSDSTIRICDICSSTCREEIIVSWRYTMANCHFIGDNITLIVC